MVMLQKIVAGHEWLIVMGLCFVASIVANSN
jgi:hypothetical protein